VNWQLAVERMTFVVFLCVCRVSWTGFIAQLLPRRQQTRVGRSLPEAGLRLVRLPALGLSLRVLAAERKGLTDRCAWVVSDGWCCQLLRASSARPRCRVGISPRVPAQHLCPGRDWEGTGALDHELQQPGTAAVRLLGRVVIRGQSHQWACSGRRMRRRGEGASRNRLRELSPVSLPGGSCFMITQQTSSLPAAGAGWAKRWRFSPASRVGCEEEMIKWQELKIR